MLAPGTNCRITLTHTPHAVGQRRGFVRITHGPLNTTLLVGLTGSGTKPTLAINPGVVATGGLTYAQATGLPAGQPFTLNLGPELGGQTRTVTRANMVLGHALDMADHYSQIANYMRLNNLLPPTALPRPRPGGA